jgi:hypothetical protein
LPSPQKFGGGVAGFDAKLDKIKIVIEKMRKDNKKVRGVVILTRDSDIL